MKVGGLLAIAPNTSNHDHTSATGLNGKTTNIKAAKANAGDFVNASPMCISCHNAHGSTRPFGLRFIAGNVGGLTGEALENGTGHYLNLCDQCHVQGTSAVEDYTGSGFVVP